MGLKRINGKLWFQEELYRDTTYGFEVSQILVPERKTDFQKLLIVDTPRFGKVLILDGIVQLTEEDEAIYHEFMAHWPLFSHPKPETVLIVGGGDGGVAREVLKHKGVKKVYLVDIDPVVMRLVKKYMPQIPKGAFSDPRLEVIHKDAEEYIKKFKNNIDVLILDSMDPIGPAISLFGADFIQSVYQALKKGGIMIRQAGSVILQPYELKGSYKQIEVVFGKDNVRTILISPSTYMGGYFSLVAAVKGNYDFSELIRSAKKRYSASKISTAWYSGDLHKNLAVLPPVVDSMLEKEKYGEEIIMDLENSKVPNLAELKEWSQKTCRAIKMLAYGVPMTSGNPIKNGTSFVQYIETSAINYRHLDKISSANIFTCTELPVPAAVKYSMRFFQSDKGNFWHLPRGSFGKISEVRKETKIYRGRSYRQYAPTLIKAEKIFSPKFKFPTDLGAPAFELVMDLYNCDFPTIASTKEVARWAKELTLELGLKPIGKTNAPDFGHAKKKTAGPSVVQFFEGGSNISHYSINWLAIFVNIVSQKEIDLKRAMAFTVKFFKAGRLIGWIIPRGEKKNIRKLAKSTYVFEIKAEDLTK